LVVVPYRKTTCAEMLSGIIIPANRKLMHLPRKFHFTV